jgi:alkaline phosphatase D
MAPEPVEVGWQVAEDEAMTRVVRRGTATAVPAWAHAVHVEVEGLEPDRWYWYQFKAGGEISPLGRTRTMPPAGAAAERLRFAFASCQHYGEGYYTAFEHMAREDLDLVVHLGDYIYEKSDVKNPVRRIHTPEIFTLDDYRARYALYKSDPALQAAHAMAPWIVTWDDHEVSNNYANDVSEKPDKYPPAEFLRRRAAAYQAYFEHMPLRRSSLPRGPDLLLYRRLEFGGLASFHVLDTRQYRTDQPLGDGLKETTRGVLDEKATLMGERQRQWLLDGLDRSAAGWNVLAQQIMMVCFDQQVGPGVKTWMDQWSGYEAERRRVIRHFRDGRARNPVVITGDIHCNWANELAPVFDTPDAPPVGVEFVGTSISSSGENHPSFADAIMAENPNVKFFNGERGYVSCEVTPKQWRADYQCVPYVDRPGAPLVTRASFLVEAGQHKLNRV